jgi:hypothetical protein
MSIKIENLMLGRKKQFQGSSSPYTNVEKLKDERSEKWMKNQH